MNDAASNGRGDEPPSPPWDAMANLRALGDIQRRGLEAANEVISRLTNRENGPTFGAESSTSQGSTDPMEQFQQLMVNGWQSLLAQVGAASGGSRGGPAEGAVTVDPLRLDPVPPGTQLRAEFWLHNLSGSDVTDVRLHCGDLRDHAGDAIASEAVSFDPGEVAELPDRSSRGIGLVIEVPGSTRPGTYRGTILASNLPEVWLPVELTVSGGATT